MVNEERLRQMIKMSQFDANDGKKCRPMMQYARKDYVSLHLLKSFVTGTVCFVILAGVWGLYSIQSLMTRIVSMDVMSLLITGFILYLIFMLIYLVATYIVFNMKYTEGRRKVKKYYSSLKKVNQIYARDERLKTSANQD
jgi:dolichyl-phosphate-mannose--protein O-mannosyl transferase